MPLPPFTAGVGASVPNVVSVPPAEVGDGLTMDPHPAPALVDESMTGNQCDKDASASLNVALGRIAAAARSGSGR